GRGSARPSAGRPPAEPRRRPLPAGHPLRRSRGRPRPSPRHVRRGSDPFDEDRVRAPGSLRDQPRQAPDPPVAPANRLGPRLRRGEPLPSRLRARLAAQARRRGLRSQADPDRARSGISLDRCPGRGRPVVASPSMSSAAAPSVLKRLLVGRAFTSHQLEPTLLPKILALPVFASDALSSVAYATGEIFIQLTLVSLAFKQLVMPISIAIASLMGIVVISYRQTVRAYPSGGGAYIVSKDNLGAPAGLIAAAAPLGDYMMTVIVSIVAGVFAIGSAFPAANEHKVLLSIMFVWLVTIANLRGARESGTLFAIPTYGFVVSILIMVVIGFV